MNITTTAQLANTLAIEQVRSQIARYRLLAWLPAYAIKLTVRRQWLAVLEAREPSLGEGSRPKRKVA